MVRLQTDVLPNYIDGNRVPSAGATALDVRNPATGTVLARVPLGTAGDVDRAAEAAAKAFPSWRETPPVVRARYLFKFKVLLEKHADEIASICTSEHGNQLHAEFVVIGSRTNTWARFLPSVSQSVVDLAPCSVLVLPLDS